MLCSSASKGCFLLRRCGVLARSASTITTSNAGTINSSCLVLGGSRSPAVSHVLRELQRKQMNLLSNNYRWRALSSDTSSSKDSSNNKNDSSSSSGEDGSDTKEIVMTPGEAVVAYSRLGLWGGILVFATACAWYIGRELFPTKMSPNRIFDNALDIVRNNADVKRRYGDKIKGYGRDHGGHREGRRNFVEHTEYADQDDGSKRTRVRFNIEGQFGAAFVFAEVSSNMPSGEFVYVLVQDKQGGRVETIVDNRAALTAQKLAGGNKESMAVMSQLLGGGKKG